MFRFGPPLHESNKPMGDGPRPPLPNFCPPFTEFYPSCNILRRMRVYTSNMSWVLVIEDEEDISEFLRYILENENFTVKTARSLAEARTALMNGLPDAVLLDRGLPDGDG